MDYIKILFGIEPEIITFNDIVNYFSISRSETNVLEFKSFNENAKWEKIYESICAFLNSDGGVLIWGAPIETKSGGVSEYLGPLMPVNQYFNKDQLISKVSGNIIPVPKGIKVYPLKEENNYIYLFEVQKSEYSPHQTGNRYYMRLDGQNQIAPHYFIEALFRKITFPRIGGYIKFNSVQKIKFRSDYGYRLVLYIDVVVMNHSQFQNEENIKFRLVSDSGSVRMINDSNGHEIPEGGSQYNETNAIGILHYGEAPHFGYKILFDVGTLEKNKFESRLFLFFGGKFSPMLTSSYLLDFKVSQQWDTNLIVKKANQVVKEVSENNMTQNRASNLTETQAVDKILGRSKPN